MRRGGGLLIKPLHDIPLPFFNPIFINQNLSQFRTERSTKLGA